MTPTTTNTLQRYPEELVASSLFLLKKLGMAAKDRSLDAYEEIGAHPAHHGILAVLDEGSRETQGSVADALGYDRGQLVGLLDELEDKGLVERQRDPADRRRHVVRITPAGRKTLDRMRRLTARLEEEFLAALDEDERRRLHETLLRLSEQHVPNCRLMLPR